MHFVLLTATSLDHWLLWNGGPVPRENGQILAQNLSGHTCIMTELTPLPAGDLIQQGSTSLADGTTREASMKGSDVAAAGKTAAASQNAAPNQAHSTWANKLSPIQKSRHQGWPQVVSARQL